VIGAINSIAKRFATSIQALSMNRIDVRLRHTAFPQTKITAAVRTGAIEITVRE
jgi:hypothetical protein